MSCVPAVDHRGLTSRHLRTCLTLRPRVKRSHQFTKHPHNLARLLQSDLREHKCTASVPQSDVKQHSLEPSGQPPASQRRPSSYSCPGNRHRHLYIGHRHMYGTHCVERWKTDECPQCYIWSSAKGHFQGLALVLGGFLSGKLHHLVVKLWHECATVKRHCTVQREEKCFTPLRLYWSHTQDTALMMQTASEQHSNTTETLLNSSLLVVVSFCVSCFSSAF